MYINLQVESDKNSCFTSTLLILNLFTSQPKIGKNTSEGERRYVASILFVVFATKRNKDVLSFNSYLKERKKKDLLILQKL